VEIQVGPDRQYLLLLLAFNKQAPIAIAAELIFSAIVCAANVSLEWET